MKEFKLIGMTDFVLSVRGIKKDNIRRFWACEKYAEFLKKTLTLGMFVPCDENGNFFEEPKIPWQDSIIDEGIHEKYHVKLNEYQKTKERVLFEGFHLIGDKEIELKGTDNCLVFNEKSVEFTNEFNQEKYVYTVEDLVELELKLTESAIKQILG